MTDNNDNVGNDPPEDDLADTYIIFAQANTWKSPNASHELAYYVDNLMRNYKYNGKSSAGIMINRRPAMDDNYAERLKNVGILIDDHDNIVSRPDPGDAKKYRASYRKDMNKLAKTKKEKAAQVHDRFVRAMGGMSQVSAAGIPSSTDSSGSTPSSAPQVLPEPTFEAAKADSRAPTAFVVGIQEPHFLYKKIPGLKGHNLLIDTKADNPRAALFYSRNLDIWGVPEFISRDMATGVYVNPQGQRIYITSLYMPDKYVDGAPVKPDEMITDEMVALMAKVKKDKADIIIMSDTNSWSRLWFKNRKANPRGKRMEEFILANRMRVMNEGERYTYVRYNSQTCVDVTMATGGVADKIEHWRVRDAMAYSDHCSIEFVMKAKGIKPILKRNLRKGDFVKYEQLMEEYSDPMSPENEGKLLSEDTPVNRDMLDYALDCYYEDTEAALDQACPKCVPVVRIPNFGWYTKEHAELKRRVRRMKDYVLRKGRKFKNKDFVPLYSEEDWKQARRDYRNACRRSRHEGYKEALRGFHKAKQVAALNRGLKGKTAPDVGLIKQNGETKTREESIDILADTHFPGSKKKPCKDQRTKKDKFVDLKDESVSWVTIDKVKAVINSFQPYKGPGPDGLQPIVFQKVGTMTLMRIVNMTKASLLLGYIPKRLLDIKVVFIPKEGKDNYTDPRSFRPISLMNFLLKIQEKLFLWHLEELIAKCKKPLHNSQHGFRKGRGCDSALTSFVTRIEYIINQQGKFAMAVFLDIQGAYDNLSNRAILKALRKRGADENFINWIMDFLKFRKITVDYKGVKTERFPTRGVPQGGIASPFLWNNNHDSFLELFDNNPSVHVECYADDCLLLVTGKDLDRVQAIMQKAVYTCEEWGRKQGLTFSPKKTEAMVFTRKRQTSYVLPNRIKVANTPVDYERQKIRYLGVWLDPKLTFRAHVEVKVNKCKGLLMALNGAMGRFWGISPQMAIWAWRGIVRPTFTFGCLVWGHVLRENWAKPKIKRLQSLAFRMMTFYRRSTPIIGLEMIMNIWPLDIHVHYLQACSFMRTRGFQGPTDNQLYTETDCLKGHRQWIEEWMYKYGCDAHNLLDQKLDTGVRRFIWEKSFNLNKASFNKASKNYGKPWMTDDLAMYTDGSKGSPKEGGFAGSGVAPFIKDGEGEYIFVSDGGPVWNSFHIGKRSSFQAEMYAILKAVEWLLEFVVPHFSNKRISIYTDSQSCVDALLSHETDSNLVEKTVKALNEAAESGLVITISWVKAHCGTEGNEKADRLANVGRQLIGWKRADAPDPPFTFVRSTFYKAAVREWNERWIRQGEIPIARQTHHWFPTSRPGLSARLLMRSRRCLSKYILIMSGHNFWNRHEYKVTFTRFQKGHIPWEKVVSPICNYCQDDTAIWPTYKEGEDGRPIQTTEHIFSECEYFATQRAKAFGSYFGKPLNEIKYKNILKFIELAKLDVIPGDHDEVKEVAYNPLADEDDDESDGI